VKKFLAFLLCVCLLLPVTSVSPFSTEAEAFGIKDLIARSDDPDTTCKKISNALSKTLNALMHTFAKAVPDLAFVRDDREALSSENFYTGNVTFLDADQSSDYTWKVGYADASVLPDDFGVWLKYARGSYCPWGYTTRVYQDEDGKDEELKIRTVLLDDQTGRGITVFCSVDCIGISNVDVQTIRAGVADLAKSLGVISLNISAIHSHMAIDSQGVWDSPISTALNNLASLKGITQTRSGVDADYLDTIIRRTRDTIERAHADMKPGKLTYTDIGLDSYIKTRSNSRECDGNIHRLAFYPEDGSRMTYIASFGVHPEITSYDHSFSTKLSSDFVYYMDKLCNLAGANFIYIQGNVGTNSSTRGKSNDGFDTDSHEAAMRYGYEMGYIMLGANMTEEERIGLNNRLGDRLGINTYGRQEGYTPWYEDLPTYSETEIKAVLNIRHKQVKFEIENGTALILLKLGLASNDISKDISTGKYYTTTEIGYMELGDTLKVFLSPGELYAELYVGGYGLRDSEIVSLRESYGDNVILFDLMNDAAGYICPDESYAVVGYKYNSDENKVYRDVWCLTVSMGKNTASVLMNGYAELVKSCR